MTAQGKINASTVQTGHRIIVNTTSGAYEGDSIRPSATKTGEGVQVTTVEAKHKCTNRRGYVIVTGAGSFYAEPIQTMWLAPEDKAGMARARKEAQAIQDAKLADEATEELEAQERDELDRLEAPMQAPANSVAANADAYWTKGCGADILARDKAEALAEECGCRNADTHLGVAKAQMEQAQQDEVAALRAEFPGADEDRKLAIQGRLAFLGTVVYPEGTPEYAEYTSKLRAALADWVEEGRKSLVADVEVIRDEAGQPAQVAVTRVPDSGYPSTSYVPVELPLRVPGAALADAMAAELVEDLADLTLEQATRVEAQEHAVRHARHARPGHTAQVQLLPMREELMGYASAELCLAVGSGWGRLEGKWLRVAALAVEDVEAGQPLYLVEAGEDEPRWWNAGTRSRRTGYVLLVGKTITVNSRPYEVRHTMAWGAPRLLAP